jgi:hypothetical protein
VGVVTYGTPREIQWGVDVGKPVVVIADPDIAKRALYLWDTVVVSTVTEAVQHVLTL